LPIRVGICGPTGSGKSTIANYLASVYNTPVTAFDTFHKPKEHVKTLNGMPNYEIPESYYVTRFGKERRKRKGIILAEGFLIFALEWLRDLFNCKIYIHLPTQEVVNRRLSRYNKEYRKDDMKYIQEVLVPCSEKYAATQIQVADLVVDGRKNLFTVTGEILTYLNSVID